MQVRRGAQAGRRLSGLGLECLRRRGSVELAAAIVRWCRQPAS